MKLLKLFTFLLFSCVTLFSAGCTTDGPMENAGESVDKTATDIGNAIEDACEETTDKKC